MSTENIPVVKKTTRNNVFAKSLFWVIEWKRIFIVFGATAPPHPRPAPAPAPAHWIIASSFTRFLDKSQRLTTVGMTLLVVWSARRRDLYLTTHNTHNRQTSMPPVAILTGERAQSYALDRPANGTGTKRVWLNI